MSHGKPMRINPYSINRIMRCEEKASKHINVLMHYDDETLIDKSGKLIKIIKLSGLDYFTQDEQTLDAYKIRRNNLLKSFSSEFAFYFYEVRRKVTNNFLGEFKEGFAKEINDKYKNKL